MPFTIVRQDITKMKVDAVVNAANNELSMGGGVCGAIFQAAGISELKTACHKLAPVETGKAIITPGFNLPAKYIIHAVGPIYNELKVEHSEQLLRSAYFNSLKLAMENSCSSITFPLISSGIYGYPKEDALRIASATIGEFLLSHDINVFLAVFDKESFMVSEQLLGEVASYIDENYVARHTTRRSNNEFDYNAPYIESEFIEKSQKDASSQKKKMSDLNDIIKYLDEPFSQTLFTLIDDKGLTDVEVYKRANMDRKLFSKIRSTKGYMPSKRTAIALAIALELDLDETEAFLRKAGYALSNSHKFDVIIEYFIIHKKYNIYEINEVLFQYDHPLLG